MYNFDLRESYRMILNKTKKSIISKKEKICTSTPSQALGLMFQPKRNLIMIFEFETKINLHMFFVFFPIDVLVVDAHLKIVEIKRNFRPWTFWSSTLKGKYVVELGFRGKYEEGDEITLS